MATLSRHPILVDFFNPENGEWNSHVSLGTWADLYLIAPATANTIGKMAHGIADNLLLTCYLSARCPVALAPAMDLDMYAHPTTQENIEKLRNLGVRIIEPGSGEAASGLTGKGPHGRTGRNHRTGARTPSPDHVAPKADTSSLRQARPSSRWTPYAFSPTTPPGRWAMR